MTRFTPKLGHDPAYMKDPDPRSEPLEPILTPAERDMAVLARLSIIAMQRQFGRNVDGLEVGTVAYADLTPEERRSLGL